VQWVINTETGAGRTESDDYEAGEGEAVRPFESVPEPEAETVEETSEPVESPSEDAEAAPDPEGEEEGE
tara:strand:+ start:2344 stop:2550 length:207 start_codon:yes stop_codon:yes gene_type:complete